MKLKVISDYSSGNIDKLIFNKINITPYDNHYCELDDCLYNSYSNLDCIIVSKSVTRLLDSWLNGQSPLNIADEFAVILEKFVSDDVIVICHTIPYIETTSIKFSPLVQEFNFWIQEFNFYIVSRLQTKVNFFKAINPLKINWELADNFDFIYNSLFFENFTNYIKCILSNNPPVKMIISDLDNTMWDGILGDDGIDGISVSIRGKYSKFGRYINLLKLLKKRGVLLAISSKNNLENVENAFLSEKIIFSKEEFVAILANWNDKGTNIKELISGLNIGADSVLFVDDNEMELDRVKSVNPLLAVCNSSSRIFPFNLLELEDWINLPNISTIDRTVDYRNNYDRLKIKQKYTNVDDYLASLEMKAKFNFFNNNVIDRIVELSLRSNQWNTKTIRMTSTDVSKYINSDKLFGFYLELSDKFGDMGIVSYILIELENDNAIINNWVMSCRVLNRGVDDFILQNICEFLKSKNIKLLFGLFEASSKNQIVAELFPCKYNFTLTDTGEYLIDLNHLVINPTKISLQ